LELGGALRRLGVEHLRTATRQRLLGGESEAILTRAASFPNRAFTATARPSHVPRYTAPNPPRPTTRKTSKPPVAAASATCGTSRGDGRVSPLSTKRRSRGGSGGGPAAGGTSADGGGGASTSASREDRYSSSC
jgi:hypothetical protein